jgi:hypothetical protein
MRRGRWSVAGPSVSLVEDAAAGAGPRAPMQVEGAWAQGLLRCPSAPGAPPDPYRRIAPPLEGAWRLDHELSTDLFLDPDGMKALLGAEGFPEKWTAHVQRMLRRWPQADVDLSRDGTVRMRMAYAPSDGAPAVLTPSRGTWRREGRRVLSTMRFARNEELPAPVDGPTFTVTRIEGPTPTVVLAGAADKEFQVILRRLP